MHNNKRMTLDGYRKKKQYQINSKEIPEALKKQELIVSEDKTGTEHMQKRRHKRERMQIRRHVPRHILWLQQKEETRNERLHQFQNISKIKS